MRGIIGIALAWFMLACLSLTMILLPVAGFMQGWPWGTGALALEAFLVWTVWRLHWPLPPMRPDGEGNTE